MSAVPDPDANESLLSCQHSCDHDIVAKVVLLGLDVEMIHHRHDVRSQDTVKALVNADKLRPKHALGHSRRSGGCYSPVTKTDPTKSCISQLDACVRGGNRGGTPCPTGRNTRNEPKLRQTLALEEVMGLESRIGMLRKSSERTQSSRNPHNSPALLHVHDGMNQSGQRKTSERSHSSCLLHNPAAPALYHDGMCLIRAGKTSERSHSSCFIHNWSAPRKLSGWTVNSWIENSDRQWTTSLRPLRVRIWANVSVVFECVLCRRIALDRQDNPAPPTAPTRSQVESMGNQPGWPFELYRAWSPSGGCLSGLGPPVTRSDRRGRLPGGASSGKFGYSPHPVDEWWLCWSDLRRLALERRLFHPL